MPCTRCVCSVQCPGITERYAERKRAFLDTAAQCTDAALASELKKHGSDIARRTVVKYRQQLDIPPARRRKVFTAT